MSVNTGVIIRVSDKFTGLLERMITVQGGEEQVADPAPALPGIHAQLQVPGRKVHYHGDVIYCMAKKSWSILHSKLLFKMDQDFLDI